MRPPAPWSYCAFLLQPPVGGEKWLLVHVFRTTRPAVKNRVPVCVIKKMRGDEQLHFLALLAGSRNRCLMLELDAWPRSVWVIPPPVNHALMSRCSLLIKTDVINRGSFHRFLISCRRLLESVSLRRSKFSPVWLCPAETCSSSELLLLLCLSFSWRNRVVSL